MMLRCALLGTLVAVGWALTGRAEEPPPQADRSPPARRLVEDGSWCWFADPRAIRHGDSTYIGYVTSRGDIDVATWDHRTGKLANSTLHPRLQSDDHANPALLRRDDGRLMVFYSAHNGRQMHYRTTTRPDDASGWGEERSVPVQLQRGNGFTYPNPVQLSAEDGRIYLFWRGHGWNPTYATTDDGGETWSKAHWLIKARNRPYVKVAGNGKDTIHLAYTDGHPHQFEHNNIYYVAIRGGKLHNAADKAVGSLDRLPVDLGTGDTVYDAKAAGAGRGWIWDIAPDAEGRPVIVFATIPDADHHRYQYARFDGKAWQVYPITEAGGHINGKREWCYSGGVVLDHDDPSVVFLSRQIDGQFEIERRQTADGGRTWKTQVITRGSKLKNVRPVVVRGHGDELAVVWMSGRYDYYTHYRTALLGWPMPGGNE